MSQNETNQKEMLEIKRKPDPDGEVSSGNNTSRGELQRIPAIVKPPRNLSIMLDKNKANKRANVDDGGSSIGGSLFTTNTSTAGPSPQQTITHMPTISGDASSVGMSDYSFIGLFEDEQPPPPLKEQIRSFLDDEKEANNSVDENSSEEYDDGDYSVRELVGVGLVPSTHHGSGSVPSVLGSRAGSKAGPTVVSGDAENDTILKADSKRKGLFGWFLAAPFCVQMVWIVSFLLILTATAVIIAFLLRMNDDSSSGEVSSSQSERDFFNTGSNQISSTPSLIPTGSPSFSPSVAPSLSPKPSSKPSGRPSITPSSKQSLQPTRSIAPSTTPSFRPTVSQVPTFSNEPSSIPSITPSSIPTTSIPPSLAPSVSAAPTKFKKDKDKEKR